jgi:hypothetical protein
MSCPNQPRESGDCDVVNHSEVSKPHPERKNRTMSGSDASVVLGVGRGPVNAVPRSHDMTER